MEPKEFFERLAIKLNKQQISAVQAIEGPVLLLAVPGSGKTTVLVTRLGYMLYCCGIDPSSILTLTYTRAATRDMAERYSKMFGTDSEWNEKAMSVDRLEFRTINSICDRIIKYYAGIDGRIPFQLESNEKALNQLVAQLFQQTEESYPTENDIKTVRSLITYIKNMRLGMEQIEKLGYENDLDLSAIYRGYQEMMRRNSRMDYDDQMVYAYNILRRSPETLAYFQQKYQYICVDEAQDTSKIQHEIIALLASSNENLFMVGDEDQSIYGFRAAYPEALLNFEKVHSHARVLLMEENFRSNAKIVAAADHFIQQNQMRHAKHMKSNRQAAADIYKVELKGRRGQYTYLLKVAQGLQQRQTANGIESVKTEQTAVLYRNNESALPLIDLLERENLPYQLQSCDMLFFTHRVVMDIRNIIAFAENPYNTAAFLQIYYKISLYINKKEAENACQVSASRGIPVLDALEDYCNMTQYRKIKIRAARTNLLRMLEEPSDRAINRIMKALEYADYLDRSGISDEKVGILKIIGAQNDGTIRDLPGRLDWLRERILMKKEKQAAFVLSTIHSSKGLEYENVFLIDCVDGIFPNEIPEANDEDALRTYEEERRMYYVAVTRAKDHLTIFTFPQGNTFTDELLGLGKTRLRFENGKRKNVQAGDTGMYKGRRSDSDSRYKSFEEFKRSIHVGDEVIHAKFGPGKIVELNSRNVKIDFENYEEKSFNLKILFEKELIV